MAHNTAKNVKDKQKKLQSTKLHHAECKQRQLQRQRIVTEGWSLLVMPSGFLPTRMENKSCRSSLKRGKRQYWSRYSSSVARHSRTHLHTPTRPTTITLFSHHSLTACMWSCKRKTNCSLITELTVILNTQWCKWHEKQRQKYMQRQVGQDEW